MIMLKRKGLWRINDQLAHYCGHLQMEESTLFMQSQGLEAGFPAG